ncbi:hypothetical protein [Hymenobacter cheonanensis]|uniref:hypothetical protein n=1 Tax=Hymenobacter sp. CA2-7 TaxID=3063993 RepID=UPI002712DF4C|nr:hypothetical protein [Hymenobacter sp. CA2-7]MDO7887004.1 hypothetical protein [Hymenobacter sp. CA2-7]
MAAPAYFPLVTSLLRLALAAPAAEPPTEAILQEGLTLYQSERAAWVATDLMLATTLDRSQLGGYLTYFRGDSVCTIFWNKESAGQAGTPLVASYLFPRQDVRVGTSRFQPLGVFSPAEARLYGIRQAALASINAHRQEFPVPANTSLNLDLLDDPSGTRVYVLTGPQQGSLVPIGNDHLLTFDPAGKLTAVERLHNSYLPLSWDAGQAPGAIRGMMHSHLAAHPYITATDICNVLLYRPAGCTQHLVVGQDYVSIFDLEKQQLAILTRKAYERMAKSVGQPAALPGR